MLEYHKFKSVYDLFMKGLETDAHELLTQLQRRYVALCDENTTLKMQIQEYEDILYLARNLLFDGQYYWLTTGSIKQGPFCPNCYDQDGVLMRLSGERYERHCPTCRIRFTDAPRELQATSHAEAQQCAVNMSPPSGMGSAKIIPFARN